jgi:hypothetical protein
MFRWSLSACVLCLCAVLLANGFGQPCTPTRAKNARQASKSWRVTPHRVIPYAGAPWASLTEAHVKVMLAYDHTLQYPMAIGASGPSLLIIEKQHSPWEQQ